MKKIIATLLFAPILSMATANVSEKCERIVSLSPTITDTLLSLGLENKIIAGTRYDRLPKDHNIQQVGGMLDPNYEAITLLSPSIILADLTEDSPQKRKLDILKLDTALLSFTSLDEIKQSINEIGKICNIEMLATQKVNELNATIENVKLSNSSPRVLMLYAYEGDDHLNTLPQRAAGKSFHQDILEAVGARNAYQGTLNAPIMSPEGMLMLNPDVILLVEGDQIRELDHTRAISINSIQPHWRNLQSLSAIQNENIFILKGESTFIASPDAVISTLKTLHSVLSQ